MKTEIYKNIDLIQIDVKAGVNEYELPKNVDWVGKKIDRLVLCAPLNACLSPIDGSSVLTESQIIDLYFDLYNGKEAAICQNLHYSNLMYSNNHPVRINDTLSLQLSRLKFTTAPTADGAILMYVYWGGKTQEDYDIPARTETITFPLAGNQLLTFTEIINTYFHVRGEKVKGVQIWGAESNPAYMTLRDHELNYIINSIHTCLARPQMVNSTARLTQAKPMYFDCVDIDFDYSNVRNATSSANQQTITFVY